ncbi:Uncharacterised protein [Bordetella pertussis]|nr:Uncharacterised protein [Bordetella pertussis]
MGAFSAFRVMMMSPWLVCSLTRGFVLMDEVPFEVGVELAGWAPAPAGSMAASAIVHAVRRSILSGKWRDII